MTFDDTMAEDKLLTRWYRRALPLTAAVGLWLGLAAAAAAQPLDGRDIVDRVEKLLWGTTVQGDHEMTIATARWQRTLGLKLWMDRPRRSFVRIVSPAKEAGVDVPHRWAAADV